MSLKYFYFFCEFCCDKYKMEFLDDLSEELSGGKIKYIIKEPSKYNMFVKKEFKKLKKEHPNMASSNIMKLVAKEWSNVKKPAKKTAKKTAKKAN